MTKYGASYDGLLLMTKQMTGGALFDPEARHPSWRITTVTEYIESLYRENMALKFSLFITARFLLYIFVEFIWVFQDIFKVRFYILCQSY